MQVSDRVGAAGPALVEAAREAFVAAMSRASIITAGVAAIGALVAWRFLPARGIEAGEDVDQTSASSNSAAPWYVVACTCTYGYGRVCECTVTASDDQASCATVATPEASLIDTGALSPDELRFA